MFNLPLTEIGSFYCLSQVQFMLLFDVWVAYCSYHVKYSWSYVKLMCWQKTALFFRGLQPVPNEEVFKIYEGTHLAITKINPSNFLNVGISSVCPMFYSVVGCLYNKSFYSHIHVFLIVSHTYDELADRHIRLILS